MQAPKMYVYDTTDLPSAVFMLKRKVRVAMLGSCSWVVGSRFLGQDVSLLEC